MKYVKVMFGNKGANFEYKIGEVNVATIWNPKAEKGRDFGGFNYANEDSILRWLHRGDTIYDVEIPEDAENIKVEVATTVYRTNKILLKNPRKVSDEMALHYYNISNIPEKSYYKALGAVSIMDYKKTAFQILRDKVNKGNIDEVLEEWNDFISHGDKNDRKDLNGLVKEIDECLKEIKSPLDISLYVEKEPYIKEITNDKIINLTGQSGSGKSTYAKQNFDTDEYIVIDTDEVLSEKRFLKSTGINKKLGEMFRNKYETLPNLADNFDLIYSEILNYCKDINKTIVIDCAQFHCIKNINLLKGKMIIIRTDIDTCYKRCIERFKLNNPNATAEEIEKYSEKKKPLYKWYKFSNEFIRKIDSI